jgi:LPXTG-motif cell wall-anchored protein
MLRTIAACSVVTAILGFAGLAVATSNANATPGHGEGHTPVNVCHATSSDTNPFVFIVVDDDSTKFKGHLMHRDSPNKTWKSDGTFNGVPHEAGDPKADLIGDYVDSQGTVHTYDGVITAESCVNHDTPPPTSCVPETVTITVTVGEQEKTGDEPTCPPVTTTVTTTPPTTSTSTSTSTPPPTTETTDTPTTDTPSTETLIPPTSSTRVPPANNLRHAPVGPVPTAIDAGLSGQELPNTGAPNHLLLLVGIGVGLLVASAGGLSLLLRRH